VARTPRAGAPPRPARRHPWFHAHTPRERVRLLYLVGLEEAARAGHPRDASDTPYEYAQRHGPELEEGQVDLEQLTEGFVQARYSRRDFAPGEVGPLRSALRHLRAVCRRILRRS
ncbi:MAG: DUF4129 domain-containing protein, partial [Anaerolineae bacterium]|nr:DUF4129 domain-containing protein [Anaerolineae bacterium]